MTQEPGSGSSDNNDPDPDDIAIVERLVDELLADFPPARVVEPRDFFAAQFDRGLAFVHFPVGLGGLGLSPHLHALVNGRLRAARAKSAAMRNPIGVQLGIPTLYRHGTQEQKLRYFRPAFTTDEIWCQLFSEPGSGSDLAGLSSRAVPDGDDWVVNGQKVWTSMGHLARVGMLLVRTDPEQPKHLGLSMFAVDMHSPGVEVRPLRQMTGDAEFNEVFLSDVRVPDADRIGELGAGWRVATTTLMNERLVHSGDGAGASNVGGSHVDKVIALAQAHGLVKDPVVRDRLVSLYIESRVIKFTNLRARDARAAGLPGPEGSITKLAQGLYNRRLQEAALDLLGASAWRPDDAAVAGAVHGFLRAQGNTIEGGTSDILRNILGERVLQLPREPGPPRNAPWSQLARNPAWA